MKMNSLTLCRTLRKLMLPEMVALQKAAEGLGRALEIVEVDTEGDTSLVRAAKVFHDKGIQLIKNVSHLLFEKRDLLLPR